MPGVARNLRIRAERPGPIDYASGRVRRDHPRRRGSLIDPRIEGAQDIERVRSRSVTLTMMHPWDHEQLDKLIALPPPAGLFHHVFVVRDRAERAQRGVGPSMVQKQFAAAVLQ